MVLRLIIYAIASASGLLLIKRAISGQLTLNFRQMALIICSPGFVIGFTLYLGAFLYWLYLLSQHELSRATPIASGLIMSFTVVFGVFFLKEKLLPINILGIILIQMGVLMVSYGK